MLRLFAVALLASSASAKVFFSENFDDGDAWKQRWVASKHKGDEAGAFDLSAGQWHGDAKKDIGLQTTEDARFYQLSAKFDEFSNKGSDLVVQYSVKHEQNIDCGGAYLKLHPAGIDQEDYNGETGYNLMFGPDICGATKRTHVIVNNRDENHLVKNDVPTESDDKSHLFTLILKSDNSFEVKIDGESKKSGNLKNEDDFGILPPKQINDPDASKPDDWDDRPMIDDPEDTKPSDWDDVPEQIADPDAEKPDDWDDELDGEWEAPMIDNPDYKGEWEPKQIENPDYKGSWKHPQIDNPDFFDDDELYAFDSFGAVGIEIWQVKSGTIFDNILITDDVAEAEAAEKDFLERQAAEEKMYDEIKEAERKAAEEAAAAAEDEEEEDEDDEEEDDEDTKDEL